jgi:hypothetical protein
MPPRNDAFADQLWRLGVSEKALLEGQGESIYRPDCGRCFQPMWLLDGLDEVTPPPGERFYQALVNLPGLKVVSCRTAVFETLRRVANRYKDQEYELLALTPPQQKTFLTHALGGDARRADTLHQRIQRNWQLRPLAGNPLMLTLIAQVLDPMALPMTRAEFYQIAVSEMWSRRLSDCPEALFCIDQRDRALIDLAQQMGMAQIRAPLAWLQRSASRVAGPDGPSLIVYLQHAGIVHLQPWEKVEFVHPTFQEFYLAQALKEEGLQQAIEHRWNGALYEETLGLLIAILFQEQRYDDSHQGLQWLMTWGEATHRSTPHTKSA